MKNNYQKPLKNLTSIFFSNLVSFYGHYYEQRGLELVISPWCLPSGFTVAKECQKIRVFFLMLFSRKFMIFYNFPNTQLSFFQCITAIYHCYINMYYLFLKRETIQRQITQFIGYPVFTGKCTVRWYKELCSYVKL